MRGKSPGTATVPTPPPPPVLGAGEAREDGGGIAKGSEPEPSIEAVGEAERGVLLENKFCEPLFAKGCDIGGGRTFIAGGTGTARCGAADAETIDVLKSNECRKESLA